MSEQAPPGPAVTTSEEKDGSKRGSFVTVVRDAIAEGNSVTVTLLAILTAIVIGGLLNAFTNTTVLSAWGNLFSDPGNAIAQAWDPAIATHGTQHTTQALAA